MKKVKVEEEMVRLDYLVLEQCVSLMKQKKFTNDLSFESVCKLFAGVIHSNHRKLKVSVKIVSHLNLSNQRWEGDLNLTTENMTESQLKSIFKEIFIRFKCFRCVSYESDDDSCQNMDGPDILSQIIISDKEYRPIKMKQLKFVDIKKKISSLISNLSSIVKEIHIRGRHSSCEDLCTAISTCTNLRSLVLTGDDQDYKLAPLRDCMKLLKNLKHFQFSFEDQSGEKVDSEWLVAAFQDNTNLHSLSLFDHYADNYDLANLCAPSMRSIMSRLRHLEISGGYLVDAPANDWTGFSEEVKRKMQQILSSVHANGCMKVVCVTYNGNQMDICDIASFCCDGIEVFTSMLTDIFGTYLEISNQAARQIDLFIECEVEFLFKVFSFGTICAIDEMLKMEEYDGMTVDRSNGHTIIYFENAKVVIQMNDLLDPTFVVILVDIMVYSTDRAVTTQVVFDKMMDRCMEAPPSTVFRFLMKVAVEEMLIELDRIGQILCRCLQAELIRAEALKGIADYARSVIEEELWEEEPEVWEYMAEVLVSAMLCDLKYFDGARPSLDDFAETFEIVQQDSRKPHVLLTLVFELLDDKGAESMAFLEMVSVKTPMLREALKEMTVEGGDLCYCESVILRTLCG